MLHYLDLKFSRAVGLGMNKAELENNKQITDYVVQDLNINPVFPFEDNSFDFVTCVGKLDGDNCSIISNYFIIIAIHFLLL